MTPHRFRQVAARAALITCLSVGAIACGDDDDDAGTDVDTEAPSGETGGADEQAAGDDTCTAMADFNAMVMESDSEGASAEEMQAMGEELGAAWAPVAEGAPAEVSDQAAHITSALDDLAAGDDEKFNADETGGMYYEVLGATIGDCDFSEVRATAVDYAYEGLPETVAAGTTALILENSSEIEAHEMAIFKLAADETRPLEEIMNDPNMPEDGPGEFAGHVFAEPGQTGTGIAELDPGRYLIACAVPTGGEEGDGPEHFTHGMFAELTVE